MLITDPEINRKTKRIQASKYLKKFDDSIEI